MKKNKLSSAPSENSSPLFGRRLAGEQPDLAELASSVGGLVGGGSSSSGSRESSADKVNPMDQNNYETIERKTGATAGSRGRDPGYETIPGEKCRRDLMDSLNAAQTQLEAATKSRNSAPAGE